MSKIRRIDHHSPAGVLYGYEFRCPGCGGKHLLPVGFGGNGVHARWSFNGSMDRPTFTPSVLARGVEQVFDAGGNWTGEWKKDASGASVPYVCHSFVTDGRIQFLGDSTHSLAGQTVDLPELVE